MLRDATENPTNENKLTYRAWKIGLLSLPIPFLLGIEGMDGIYSAGQVLRWVILVWVVSWLGGKFISKKKSEALQAKLKLYSASLALATAVGLTLTVWLQERALTTAINQIFSAHSKIMGATDISVAREAAKSVDSSALPSSIVTSTRAQHYSFILQLTPVAVDFKAAILDVEQQLEALGPALAGVLEPSSLVSKSGIEQNQKTLKALEAIVNQRDRAFADYWRSAEGITEAVGFSGRARERMLNSLGKGAEQESLLSELSAATRSYIGASQAIVDLVAAASGQVRVVGGELRFDNKVTGAKYDGLLNEVESAGAREEAAGAKYQAYLGGLK